MNDFNDLPTRLRDIADDETIEFSDQDYNTLQNAAEELERLEDEVHQLLAENDNYLEEINKFRERQARSAKIKEINAR
jgi:archaellum component FlaC